MAAAAAALPDSTKATLVPGTVGGSCLPMPSALPAASCTPLLLLATLPPLPLLPLLLLLLLLLWSPPVNCTLQLMATIGSLSGAGVREVPSPGAMRMSSSSRRRGRMVPRRAASEAARR
jgi:hypothetical protein